MRVTPCTSAAERLQQCDQRYKDLLWREAPFHDRAEKDHVTRERMVVLIAVRGGGAKERLAEVL